MRAKDLTLAQLLDYEPFAKEGKLIYSDSTLKCLARLVALSQSTKNVV